MGERKIGLMNDEDQVTPIHDVSPDEGPREWTEKYLEKNRILYDYKTSSFILDGSAVELDMIVSQIRLTLYQEDKLHFKNFVLDALRLIRKKKDFLYIKEVKERFSYNPGADESQFQVLMKAITGDIDDLNCSVLKHWMWLVKRKLWGLATDNEMMIVLYGTSGSGKSYFVRKLLSPLDEFVTYTDMRVFNDKFGVRQFTRNRVMVFDELDMVSEVSVDKLKNVITAEQITWRMLRSEAIMSGKQNCSFIATTNVPVNEKIMDPTSCRRYWQFDTLSKIQWDKINEIDYVSLWKSIDENDKSPIDHLLEAVSQRQQETVSFKDPVDLWAESIEYSPINESAPQSSIVYEWFQNFCEESGIPNYPSFHQFTRHLHSKLKSKGFNGEIKHHNYNGTVWAIKKK